MTEPKFTPGPWHPPHFGDPTVRCDCRSIVDEGYAGGIALICVDNGIISIADGGNDAPPREEAIANGHLIAAAPDLYAALAALLLWLEGGESDPATTGEGEMAKMAELQLTGEAVLAKARGETP